MHNYSSESATEQSETKDNLSIYPDISKWVNKLAGEAAFILQLNVIIREKRMAELENHHLINYHSHN